MEYCEGGELFNFIVKNRRLSEDESAFFYYQLINGLEYIHSLGIVHRDLKPENLLLTKDHLLKIIDFGLSNYFKKGQNELLITPCGSPCYASPEMVAGNKYDGFKIDIWSTGIILYAMLCGYLPFEDKDNEVLFEKILECKLEFPIYITKISKDLIEKILVTDPNKRITIPEIKNHPFFIKGKELFEQEFSICQNDIEDTEINYENIDLNNILDSSIFKDNTDISDISERNEKQNEKDKIKGEIKEKDIKFDNISEKRKNKEKKISINDLNQENIIQRLNTDYKENLNNLRKSILIGFEKNNGKDMKYRNNSSMKKKNKRNNAKNNKKNTIDRYNNKKIVPFKKRDIVVLKNNKNNEKGLVKKEIKNKRIKSKDFRNNKKLIKTNNYNNIKKEFTRKKNVGKSVDLRNLNFKKNNKNLIHKKINNMNIIKNKFNSKENLKKNDNIYMNYINNTIDEESLTNKKYLNYDFKLYNDPYRQKKIRSVVKKNIKLTSLETTFNKKNKKYLNNLLTINSSIKKYENKLNSAGYQNPKTNIKNNAFGIRYNLLKKINNNNNRVENNLNKSGIKTNREKIKIPNIKTNIININEKINIINDTQDENNTIDNNFNNNIHNNINIINKGKNKIFPKNTECNIKVNKEKFMKKDVGKLNHIRLLKHNSNIHNNNQGNIKINYYLNEIGQRKKLDSENYKTHKPGIHTDIIDISEIKKNKNDNLKKMIINDYKNKSINNKTEIIVKKNTIFVNKKNIMINSRIIKHISGLNSIETSLKTEPNKIINNTTKKVENDKYKNNYINEKSDKKQFYSKKISSANTNNLHPKNKNPKNVKKENNIFSNYTKINKTSNKFNFNTINNSNISKNNPFNSNNKNILEIINTSENYNTNNSLNKKMNINDSINNNRKNSQIMSNNHKKTCVTIKNTFINLNIDTGFILSSSIDKKRKPKKINSKHGTNNSTSQINNNHIYGFDSRYNKYVTNPMNEEIDNINKRINEINPKSMDINDNYNVFSINDDNDSNNNLKIINKNSNYQKIYVYGDKIRYKKNLKTYNNIKFNKDDKIKNNSKMNYNIDKRHNKYKSMKLDDYYNEKKKKKNLREININNNENSLY